MRKLLIPGILLVLFVGCQTKNPVGPGTVTVTQGTTSTTTSTIVPFRRYVALQVPPNVPNDMTLYFTLVSGGTSFSSVFSSVSSSPFRGSVAVNRPLASSNTYGVTGVYATLSGIGGVASGQLVGTLDGGTFTGSLTAETQGCTAERQFSGQLTKQILQWTAGQSLRTCPGNALAFQSFTLLGTDAPPPTTTAASSSSTTITTTTTSVVCMYSLSPASATIGSAGASGQVHISATAGCAWTVQASADWISVQSAFEGSGPADVRYTVPPNPGSQRTGVLTIAGLQFFIVQTGAIATRIIPAVPLDRNRVM